MGNIDVREQSFDILATLVRVKADEQEAACRAMDEEDWESFQILSENIVGIENKIADIVDLFPDLEESQ